MPSDSNSETTMQMDMTEIGRVSEGDKPSATPKQKSSAWLNKMKPRCLKFGEVLLLTLALLVIIGTVSLPTVYYALPTEQVHNF